MNASSMVLGDIAYRGQRLWSSRVAFVWEGRTRTYGEMAGRVNRFAHLLRQAGITVGSRVAILSPNQPECLECCLAISLLGAVVVPINVRLAPAEIRFQIEDAEAGHALIHPQLESLAQASGLLDRQTWFIGVDLDDALDRCPAEPVTDRPDPSAPFMQLYTSGTTGRSKGCLLSNLGWLASNANLLHGMSVRPHDSLLAFYPFFHVAGFGIAMAHLQLGGTLVLAGTVDAGELWQLIDAQEIHTLQVPSLRQLLRHPLATARRRPWLRAVAAGAAMEPLTTFDLLEEVLPGVSFYGIYGSTEAGNYATLSSKEDERGRPGTVGRPLIGFDAVILGPDDRPLPPGEVGELALRGPSTMLGYWKLPEATAKAFAGGWLHTGDLMHMDEEGYLYFVDRAKDMVKTGGENVYSMEVEQHLIQHPDVVEAAVIGVPDRRWGEAVKAIVVLYPGASTTAEDLDAFCLSRMGAFKRPRWYEFVERLPRNPTGKILKRTLRDAHDPAQAIRLKERS